MNTGGSSPPCHPLVHLLVRGRQTSWCGGGRGGRIARAIAGPHRRDPARDRPLFQWVPLHTNTNSGYADHLPTPSTHFGRLRAAPPRSLTKIAVFDPLAVSDAVALRSASVMQRVPLHRLLCCPLLPWSRASSIRRPVEAHIRRGWRCSVGGGGPGCPPPCCALALPPCLSFLPVRAPAPFGRRVLVRVPVLFGPAPVFPPGGARAGALPCPSFCWSCPCPVTGAPLRLIMLGGFVLFLRAGVPWRALAAWCFGTPPAGCTFTLSSIGTGFRPCVP